MPNELNNQAISSSEETGTVKCVLTSYKVSDGKISSQNKEVTLLDSIAPCYKPHILTGLSLLLQTFIWNHESSAELYAASHTDYDNNTRLCADIIILRAEARLGYYELLSLFYFQEKEKIFTALKKVLDDTSTSLDSSEMQTANSGTDSDSEIKDPNTSASKKSFKSSGSYF